jgi:hypothetical protein
VEHGAAASLVVSQQTSATASQNTPFSPVLIVQIRDAAGNVVTSDDVTQITAFARNDDDTGDATGSLTGTVTVTVDNGVATFVGVAHDTVELIRVRFTSDHGVPLIVLSNQIDVQL